MDIIWFFLFLILFLVVLYFVTYLVAKKFKLRIRSPFDSIIMFGFILLPWFMYSFIEEQWPGNLPIIGKHWDKFFLAVISVSAYSLFNAYRLKKSSR